MFSVLIGNADMHLKNWSLLYPETHAPVLSPAYDFVATLPYIRDDKLALTFGGSRSLDGITVDQMRRFTDRAGLPTAPVMRIVQETAEATGAAWRKLEHKSVLPVDILKVVNRQVVGAAARILKEFS